MSNLEESTPIRPKSPIFLNGLEDVRQDSDDENEANDVEEVKIDEHSKKRKGVALENLENKKRTTSKCWDHFTKVTIGGELKAKCNHCAKLLIDYYFPKIYGVGVAGQIMRAHELSEELVKYYEAKSMVSSESSTSIIPSHDTVIS